MYQRSYYPNECEEISVPTGYDGNINFEKPKGDEVACEVSGCEGERKPGLLSHLGLDIGNIFGRLEFGIEELLLIGAAIFLFVSKSRDFECIFILLALLFIR